MIIAKCETNCNHLAREIIVPLITFKNSPSLPIYFKVRGVLESLRGWREEGSVDPDFPAPRVHALSIRAALVGTRRSWDQGHGF